MRRSREVAHLADLQVMARHALVVGDRHLAPQREAGLAERRVPGAAGPAEVLRRAGVVHRGGATRRSDHRLHPAHRRRDVEVHAVHVGDGRVHQVLQPRAQVVLALDDQIALGLEPFDRLADGGAGPDRRAHGAHVVLDAHQLVPTPGVGLGEVDRRAERRPGPQVVALGTDGVVLTGVRRVGVAKPSSDLAVGRRRRHGRLVEHCPQCRGERVPVAGARVGRHRLEERSGLRRARPHRGLVGCFEGLSAGRHHTLLEPSREAGHEPRQRVGHGLHAASDQLPVRLGGPGHQVEHLADRLQRAGDIAERAQVLVGLEERQARTESFGHERGRHPLVVIGQVEGGQRGERGAIELGPLRHPVGRVVGEPVVETGDADGGGLDGVELARAADVVVAERADVVGAGHPPIIAGIAPV